MSGSVKLNVGGTVFQVERSTLNVIPGSLLSSLDNIQSRYEKTTDCYYFDRDPVSFCHVLNAYRDGELHVTRDVCPQQFRRDLEFWGLTLDLLAPCCWKYFYEAMEDVDTLTSIMDRLKHHKSMSRVANTQTNQLTQDKPDGGLTDPNNFSFKLWMFLEEPTSSLAAKLYRGFDIMLLSLESSFREFVLLLFAFIVCIIIYGIMLFAAEAEKDNFQNVFTAMWWALITMTTIGYGDYYPTTALGYCVGAVCAINGLIVLALPIAALASNFSNFYSHHSNMQKHENEINMQMTNKMTVDSVESLQTTKGDNQHKH
ncbi:KCNA2-like protein [Mya arenaria]|uniref:KCNA2-like protein n=1 Tax=Mya arenaria TaxID=6604 RepID=A0ABY7FNU7_MYAAR|nr:KCNA2-like protein [Mya arenaria]